MFLWEKVLIFLQVTNLLFSSMSNWLNNELKKKNDEAKKKVRHLDKNHMKDFKNVRNRICSRIDNIDKMRRKLRGNKQTEVRQKIFFNFFYFSIFFFDNFSMKVQSWKLKSQINCEICTLITESLRTKRKWL